MNYNKLVTIVISILVIMCLIEYTNIKEDRIALEKAKIESIQAEIEYRDSILEEMKSIVTELEIGVNHMEETTQEFADKIDQYKEDMEIVNKYAELLGVE